MSPTSTAQHHPAQDGGLPGVIASTLPIGLVLSLLVWVMKPWKRSNLPRARVLPHRDNEDE